MAVDHFAVGTSSGDTMVEHKKKDAPTRTARDARPPGSDHRTAGRGELLPRLRSSGPNTKSKRRAPWVAPLRVFLTSKVARAAQPSPEAGVGPPGYPRTRSHHKGPPAGIVLAVGPV